MLLAWQRLRLPWLFTELAWICILGLLSGASAYVHSGPFSDTTGSPCLFNSLDEYHFSLLDPSDGMPFTNIDGQLRKISRPRDSLPLFHFSRPVGEQFNVDLLLNSSYLALSDSGYLRFVDRSSNGMTPIANGSETFITSIFDVSCNGTISIRLPDLLQYNFIYHAQSRSVLGLPNRNQKALVHRTSSALRSFIKRTEQPDYEDLSESWSPFSFLVGPIKVSDRDQIGFSPRCPSKPFGLESFVKPGARPASFNGCGAENGMKIPDLRFTDCCDNHDLCYDDCSKTWNQCNDEFRRCMHSQCRHDPSWTEWGCNNLADVYADFVGTRLGAWSFYNSNVDRCTCGCPAGTINCTDMCLRDCRERCNFVDCATETSVFGKRPKPTLRASANSTSTPKTTMTPGSISNTSITATSSGSPSLLSTNVPKTTGTSNSSSSAPSTPPSETHCSESDSNSWWPFQFWSTAPCAAKNANFRAPREKLAKNGPSTTS
ncbi:hypothetical protein FKW77_005766 [Venturia effusa]|uniref:Phospholipase A2 domain-containing protein n=1 Tax=Venturia effusa TaxID=50376 RepID=A0A517LLK6_9PEZI|nr:hypothetical protein FKW77_005766 [Venturia effusa]